MALSQRSETPIALRHEFEQFPAMEIFQTQFYLTNVIKFLNPHLKQLLVDNILTLKQTKLILKIKVYKWI